MRHSEVSLLDYMMSDSQAGMLTSTVKCITSHVLMNKCLMLFTVIPRYHCECTVWLSKVKTQAESPKGQIVQWQQAGKMCSLRNTMWSK